MSRRHDTPAGEPTPDPLPGPGPWMLVVDTSLPNPARDSGSLRLVNLMRVLQDAGYRPIFFADDGGNQGEQAEHLRRLGIHVPTSPAPAWLHRHGARLEGAVLCRHYTAGHWLGLVRANAPQARVVFDTVDLHFVREQREAELRDHPRLLRHARGTRRRELALVAKADVTWVVSPVERDLLASLVPDASVQVMSNIVPEGGAGLAFEARRDLVFVGGMRHPPNRDAVQWLAGDILPAIRRLLPDVQLHLVGEMPEAMQQALRPVPGLRVHGHVPDIEPFMSGCRVALAPLRFGAGVKGKINLSMAHGQPVVATSCAVEGMHLQAGDDVLIAEDAAGLAAQVARLYQDEALWQRLSLCGRDNIRVYFSPDAARSTLLRSMGRATEQA